MENFPEHWHWTEAQGQWKEGTAGGSANFESWWSNPQFKLTVPPGRSGESTPVHISLMQQDAKYQVNGVARGTFSIGFTVFNLENRTSTSIVRLQSEMEMEEAKDLAAQDAKRNKFQAPSAQITMLKADLTSPDAVVVTPTYDIEVASTGFAVIRSMTLDISLQSGDYMIVPTTYRPGGQATSS